MAPLPLLSDTESCSRHRCGSLLSIVGNACSKGIMVYENSIKANCHYPTKEAGETTYVQYPPVGRLRKEVTPVVQGLYGRPSFRPELLSVNSEDILSSVKTMGVGCDLGGFGYEKAKCAIAAASCR